MQVSVADAKNKLPELIKAVEDGEPVTICRRGVPVVDIVRTKKPTRKKRVLGTLKGKIQVLDPNWWKPMTDEEVEAFLAGQDWSAPASGHCNSDLRRGIARTAQQACDRRFREPGKYSRAERSFSFRDRDQNSTGEAESLSRSCAPGR